jgi:hypothetical protein
MKIDIGIIGAMEEEVSLLASSLSDSYVESFSGMNFYIGSLHGKHVAVVKCVYVLCFALINQIHNKKLLCGINLQHNCTTKFAICTEFF